jgi:hypothetical protein
MRTLGFRTHVLVALAAAVGVIAALSRPWYAAAPTPVDENLDDIGELRGPIDNLSDSLGRWVGESAGTTGWDALGSWGSVIAALAAIAAVGAVGCLLPATQGIAREALRYASLACFGVAVWKLLDQPGPNDALELRYGAFVAAGAALVVLTTGAAVASAPLQRRGT